MSSVTAHPTPDLPETFWAYLAGIMDGEGSILICANGVRCVVTNTYLPMLEYFQANLCFGTIHELNAKSLQARRSKICYTYNIGANGARTIIPKIEPYLIEKRDQALAVLTYLDTMRCGPADNNLPHIQQARTEAKARYDAAVSARR